MANNNTLKYGDYAIKVTLTHHYLWWEDFGYWDESDCDFWLYKSEKSADRKIAELESEYKTDEDDGCDDYYTIRKEVCLLWD